MNRRACSPGTSRRSNQGGNKSLGSEASIIIAPANKGCQARSLEPHDDAAICHRNAKRRMPSRIDDIHRSRAFETHFQQFTARVAQLQLRPSAAPDMNVRMQIKIAFGAAKAPFDAVFYQQLARVHGPAAPVSFSAAQKPVAVVLAHHGELRLLGSYTEQARPPAARD